MNTYNWPHTLQGPPFDLVMVFKVLVLQEIYILSDDKTEYQST